MFIVIEFSQTIRHSIDVVSYMKTEYEKKRRECRKDYLSVYEKQQKEENVDWYGGTLYNKSEQGREHKREKERRIIFDLFISQFIITMLEFIIGLSQYYYHRDVIHK